MPDQNANPNPDPNAGAAPDANPGAGLLLVKTTIVPPGNPVPILAEPILKVIVIGNYPNVVSSADTAATLPPLVDRKVIWFPDGLPANYQEEFGPAVGVIAFSLSIDNRVIGIIIDPNADYLALDGIFEQAGQ